MLANASFDVGPFNVPVWLVAAVVGYALALVVQKTLLRNNRGLFRHANDLLLTGLLWGFLTWKLTPLVTRFSEIAATPLRLLYYPGGTSGIIAGFIVAGIAIVVAERRRARRTERSAEESPNSRELFSARRLVLASVITLAFVLVPVAVTSLIPTPASRSLPDAPVVLLTPDDARETTLANLTGSRPAVLVFWATWCGPCTAQMPEVQRAFERIGERASVIAVNLIATEPGIDAVRGYLEENGITVPVALDRADELRRELDVAATPTTIVYDGTGLERGRRTGAVTASWIERRVLPLLP